MQIALKDFVVYLEKLVKAPENFKMKSENFIKR